MNDELKPCPFCGGEAYIERKGTSKQSMIIGCDNCGAMLETGEVYGLTPADKWAWNRRADMSALPAGHVAVPRVLKVLADWENQCGTLAYIAPNEQADLCERLMQAAVIESPRQAVARLAAAEAKK